MNTEIQGQIEHITYHNRENSYTIAKIKTPDKRALTIVVGNIISPTPGEILKMKGQWTNHSKYGEQFKIISYETITPATIHGIVKYLGSGLIKGVGPEMAKRIVNKFGENTFDIIETNVKKLKTVKGIGSSRIKMIKESWDTQKEIRNVMLFLQGYNVSPAYATKIFRQYGAESIKVVKENPFRLATDVFGIGFLTADKIAGNLGIPKDSLQRLAAGIQYVLQQMSNDGHVYYPHELLVKKCCKILGVESTAIRKAFSGAVRDRRIIIEDIKVENEDIIESIKAVYPARSYLCETEIAAMLKVVLCASKTIKNIDTNKALRWVRTQLPILLAEKQKEAVKCAITSKVMVVTGGPGTGKTTIINTILKIFSQFKAKVLLSAPTGRAAKRMNETTGWEAKTIHRLLAFNPKFGSFEINESNPLECDLLIVDEASMIDNQLMYHLLKAIPEGATLILVGDANQLPSVGAGNILSDIITSGVVPVIELNEIFRQSKESHIVVNAHMINSGIMPPLKNTENKLVDFYFIQRNHPEEVLKTIVELTVERIPDRFGFDPFDDIQVLTPMHRGAAGTESLNQELQKALNTKQNTIIKGGRSFSINDKVMQIKNNYDRETFNGDIGRIADIDIKSQSVTVIFYDRHVKYSYAELDEIILAFAISVHKSQGSEFPAVVMPVLMQHYMLLQRNLVYTAITRGKKLVVIVGDKKALAIGIKNNKSKKRYSYLTNRIKKSMKKAQGSFEPVC